MAACRMCSGNGKIPDGKCGTKTCLYYNGTGEK